MARSLVDALLVGTFAFELQFDAYALEGVVAELADRVLNAGGDDEVLGLLLLQDEPHALHVVLGVAPVAQAAEVAQEELLLLALLDAGSCQRNLTGDEGLAAALTLVVEEDARAAVHIVSLAILLDNPEAVLLGHSVWRVGMERRVLVLGNLFHLAIKLRRRGLIDAARVGHA